MSNSKTRLLQEVQKELDLIQEQYRNGMINLEEKMTAMLGCYYDQVEAKFQKQIADYLTQDDSIFPARTDIERAQYILGKEQQKKEIKKQLDFYIIVKENPAQGE